MLVGSLHYTCILEAFDAAAVFYARPAEFALRIPSTSPLFPLLYPPTFKHWLKRWAIMLKTLITKTEMKTFKPSGVVRRIYKSYKINFLQNFRNDVFHCFNLEYKNGSLIN